MRLVYLLFFTLLSFNCYSQTGDFSNESEVSIVASGGNSIFQTYNLKTLNRYDLNKNVFQFSGHYTLGSSTNVVSARNWDLTFRYEREFSPRSSMVVAEKVEGDKFSGIEKRFNTDLGAAFYFLKKDTHKFFIEYGLRYTKETNILNERKKNSKLRLYLEDEVGFNENMTIKLWIEYIPGLNNSDDYLINFGPSLSAKLTSIFFLKVSYQGNYDNSPATSSTKKMDYIYTTSVVVKF